MQPAVLLAGKLPEPGPKRDTQGNQPVKIVLFELSFHHQTPPLSPSWLSNKISAFVQYIISYGTN